MSFSNRPMSIPRYRHGSRVPGWDDAVDLTKPPATVPDPATTEVPEELRAAVEAAMAKYPDKRSAAIPALHAAQSLHGWCSPEAIDQVAAVMELTPAYLTAVATFYDMLETRAASRSTTTSTSARTSRARCSARTSCSRRCCKAAEGDETVHVMSFECLGACDIAPMASVNGEYIGPLDPSDAPRIVEQLHAGEAVLPDKNLRVRACQDPNSHPEGHNGNAPSSESH